MKRTEVPGANEVNLVPLPDPGESFLKFIGGATYPCVGAKSALARGAIETHVFGTLGHGYNDRLMLDGLSQFVSRIEESACNDDITHSYAAIFRGPVDMTETRFESLMWTQLWQVHRLDILLGNPPADDVSSDTESPRFSLSIAGHPFFVIGLHAHASRLARRFTHPVLVFNSHRQFEKLREDGRYWKIQAATRSRDVELQGFVNPGLADFGELSEAKQYSGRKVETDWRCPFDFRYPSNSKEKA